MSEEQHRVATKGQKQQLLLYNESFKRLGIVRNLCQNKTEFRDGDEKAVLDYYNLPLGVILLPTDSRLGEHTPCRINKYAAKSLFLAVFEFYPTVYTVDRAQLLCSRSPLNSSRAKPEKFLASLSDGRMSP